MGKNGKRIPEPTGIERERERLKTRLEANVLGNWGIYRIPTRLDGRSVRISFGGDTFQRYLTSLDEATAVRNQAARMLAEGGTIADVKAAFPPVPDSKWQKLKEAKRMQISPNIYYTLVSEATSYTDSEAYASALALSSIWGDAPEAPIPEARFSALVRLHQLVTMPFRDLLGEIGMTQAAFACRICAPKRTVENWCGGVSSCPVHERMLVCEALELMPFRIE